MNSSRPTWDDRTPSIDVDLQAIPMLTALSLPGSVDSSFGALVNTNAQLPQTNESTPRTLALSLTSDSLSTSLLQTSPTSLSPSPSPVSAVRSTRVETRVLELPSPSLSLSPFTSAFPSPILEQFTSDDASMSQTGAAEYAAAVMSSVWGGQGDHTVVRAPENGGNSTNTQHMADVAAPGERDCTNNPIRSPEVHRTRGIMTVLKKFGGKIKTIIREKKYQRPQAATVNIDGAVSPHSHGPRVSINGARNCAAAQLHGRQPDPEFVRISQESEIRSPPAPPGLLVRRSYLMPLFPELIAALASAKKATPKPYRSNIHLVSSW
jgi:hypothetical protein